jgi:succinate dehydrogenase / fumarate reductase cytochrome b subunit
VTAPSREREEPNDPRGRLLRRVFTLTGVVPLGAFVVVHAAINARAVHGDQAFTTAVHMVQSLPGLAVLEWVLVFAPLLVHGGIGLWLTFSGRGPRSPRARGALPGPSPLSPSMRLAMRASGVLAVAFLAMHLPELRLHAASAHADPAVLATVLDADLSSTQHGVPWRALAYLVGASGVTFHFAVGLWSAFAATARGQARVRERRVAAFAAAALGLATWITFANVIVFRATGAELFGSERIP